MSTEHPELQVLLKELEHADRQIGDFMGLQMKVVGVVGTLLAATLGLLFATEGSARIEPQTVAKILVVVSIVGSFGMLQSLINYGIALSYMFGKAEYIAPRIQKILDLEHRPLRAIEAFRKSPARVPVLLATVTVAVGLFVLNAVVLWHAWRIAQPGSLTQYSIIPAAAVLLVTGICQVKMTGAMKRTGVTGEL